MKAIIFATILSVTFSTKIVAREGMHHQHGQMKDSSKPASAIEIKSLLELTLVFPVHAFIARASYEF
jgi:hypothetical protein